MAQAPIRLYQILDLAGLGISQDFFKFSTLSIESEKYICVRETLPGNQGKLVVIDLAQPNNLQRLPAERMSDAAMMHPKNKLIALRDSTSMQLWNLTTNARMQSVQIREPVVFWKWVSDHIIGYVTANAVFHWNIDEAQPVKVFDRLPTVNGTILNYKVDPSQKFCVLSAAGSGQNGAILGQTQFFSVEKNASSFIEAHAACFSNFKFEGASGPSTMFSFIAQQATGGKLTIIEVARPPNKDAFATKQENVTFHADSGQDFPIAMHISEKHGIIFVVTKNAFIYLYDLETASSIYMNKLSPDAIFITCPQDVGGLYAVNRRGQVLGVTIDESQIVSHIGRTNPGLSLRISSRANLPGAEELYTAQFGNLFNAGKLEEAARLAAISPGTVLRNPQTIERFKNVQVAAGQKSPLLQYFKFLLERGRLDKHESIELARQVLMQNRKDFLEQWVREDKLECSQELGTLVKQVDPQLALEIFKKTPGGAASGDVMQTLIESNNNSELLKFVMQSGRAADITTILDNLAARNPQGAIEFATQLINHEGGGLIDLNAVIDVFMKRNQIAILTPFLIDALRANRSDQGFLQTRLLELNLKGGTPGVADAILTSGMFTHYDRKVVGTLCEKALLFQRALEHFTELADIKRCLLNGSQVIPQEWVVGYFANLSVEYALECMRDLLTNSIQRNLQMVTNIAIKYHAELGPLALISLFEGFRSFEGLFYFLGAIANFSTEKEVHFKYIEAASRMGDLKEVERVTRVSNVYDPVRVKDFLKEAKLNDQRPLINVCDRFNFVEELTQYLFKSNMHKYIELYVQRVAPQKTPQVIGALLDLDEAGRNEEWIMKLLLSVRGVPPNINPMSTEDLVAQVEKRNRLRLLLNWLEARVAEGNHEAAVHNALGKIYVDMGRDAENWLKTNQYYDHRVVGAYCEKKADPHLATIAYRKGECDQELIAVTNKNSLFKPQARYLVWRQNMELWEMVLKVDNPHRQNVINQVVGTALPESKDAKEVSTTVRAFMAADLPHELIELLEKIVLQSSDFSNNRNLQNLLILTAIKADPTRVMGYVTRLDNYDSQEIADLSLSSGLFEEAFTIFKKSDKHYVNAIGVLLDCIKNMERAVEFAARIDRADVWSRLALAQMGAGMMHEAIEAFIRADDATAFTQVIKTAESAGVYDDLVRYLQMARKKNQKDAYIDTELIYAFAKSNRLGELEEFIAVPNHGEIQAVGERVFEEGLYEAAKILFTSIANFGLLASALVKLKQYPQAVEAAKRADSVRSWKEVHAACVEASEFKLAMTCGMAIINHADEVDELVFVYELRGHFDALIALMEQAVNTIERPHKSVVTELAILYAKYKETKLFDYIKVHWGRMHIPKLLHVCEAHQHWREAVFLYEHSEEFDAACTCMIEHAPDCWDHSRFKEIVAKVQTLDVFYKGIAFYVEQQPTQVNDLLNVLIPKVEHSAVVSLVKKLGALPIIKPYLQVVQKHDITSVNEALNDMYVEEGNFEELRQSVDNFGSFDQLALAQRLERHELLEFRRISAYLYKKNKRYDKSVHLSKQDGMFQDAMATAATSGDRELAEALLTYFVEMNRQDCFAACLATCQAQIRPDVAMELAWRNNMFDFAMPYLLSSIRDFTSRLAAVEKKLKDEEVKRAEQKKLEEQPMDQGLVEESNYYQMNLAMMTGALNPAMTGAFPMMTGTVLMQPNMMSMGRPM